MGLHYLDAGSMTVETLTEIYLEDGVLHASNLPPSVPLDDRTYRHALEELGKPDGVEISNDCRSDDRVIELPGSVLSQATDYSVIALRLGIESERIGALVVGARGRGRYTAEHGRLIASVKEPIAIAVSNARRYRELTRLRDQLRDENEAMRRDLASLAGSNVMGADFGLRQTMDLVRQVAPQNSPVLLLGETGTGKEVIANAIHQTSPRRDGPIVRVQCGAVPDTLLDAELFGHEEGAFTGAVRAKRGRFERADGGTIFLDEIAELSPDAQVKLLRVLQEKEFERLGGDHTVEVDVRVIAATHRDLEAMVADGRFRQDLWFRLNVFPIRIPPLRARKGDIPSLVHHFIERKAREMNLVPVPPLDPDALTAALDYHWPGNVRELQNIVERALIVANGRPLRFQDLIGTNHPAGVVGLAQQSTAAIPTLAEANASHIRKALALTRNRISGPNGAARLLDVHPSTLRARMRKLGLL
jgi:transcriptional regulator with GAF, ATPase, and Fis domain